MHHVTFEDDRTSQWAGAFTVGYMNIPTGRTSTDEDKELVKLHGTRV